MECFVFFCKWEVGRSSERWLVLGSNQFELSFTSREWDFAYLPTLLWSVILHINEESSFIVYWFFNSLYLIILKEREENASKVLMIFTS